MTHLGMDGHAPEISVVVPTHNRRALLARTLAGALDQEGVDHEVVVVDDGSSDGTAAFLSTIDDPRLRVVRHDRAEGVAAARNDGIAQARGAWLAFLDDDDLWSPGKLARQLAASGHCGWVYSPAVVVDRRDRVIGEEKPPPGDAIGAALLRFNAIPAGCSNVLVRRLVLESAGGFDPELRMFADWDMWLRLAAASPAARAGAADVAYVSHGANMHVREAGRVPQELEVLRRKHPRLDPDPVWLSRWLAGGHRRAGNRVEAARAYLRGALDARSAGNVARAAGVLAGEPLMRAYRRVTALEAPAEPAWLAPYRGARSTSS